MDILINLKLKKNRDRHFRDLLSAKNIVEIEELIFDEIFLDDVYCVMDCPKSNRENVEVLDIGGHHGYWSLFVKEIYKYQSGSPNVNCTIVEAMKDNADIIRLIHGDDNKTEIFEAICGSEANRPEYVFTPNDHSAGAILLSGVKELERFKPNWRKKGKLSKLEKRLDIFSIKDYLSSREKVDLMKIDCEGSEYEIFPELFETDLLERVDVLMMEIHKTPEDRAKMVTALKKRFPYHLSLTTDYKVAIFSRLPLKGMQKSRIKINLGKIKNFLRFKF